MSSGSLASASLLRWWLGTLLVLVGLSEPGVATAGQQVSSEEARVKQVFIDYKNALVNGDGVAAAALVDQKTLEYFGELKDLAVSADEATVRARPFVDRLLTISMRQILAPSELRVLELGELMNRAVAEGWISPQTVAQLDIGKVTVTGDSATAEALSLNPALSLEADSDEGAGLDYQFSRENDEWKFGFSSLVSSLNRMIEEFTAQLGTDQDELIFVLVQSLTGKPVLPEVWQLPTETPP